MRVRHPNLLRLTVFTLLAAILVGGPIPIFLAFALSALYLLAVVCTLPGLVARLEVEPRRRQLQVGEGLPLQIRVSSPLPGSGRLICPAPPHWSLPITLPAGVQTTELLTTPLSRGIYHWPELTWQSEDPLGLIRVERHLAFPFTVVVLPKPQPVLPGSPLHQALRERLQGPRWSFERGDFIGITPFRPGQDVRDIHWPISAKRGALWARQYGRAPGRGLQLLLAGGPHPRFEQAVAVAAGIVVWAEHEGLSLSLLWPTDQHAAPLHALAACGPQPQFDPVRLLRLARHGEGGPRCTVVVVPQAHAELVNALRAVARPGEHLLIVAAAPEPGVVAG